MARADYDLPKQREVNHVQPAQDAVDDCPQDRMVGGVGYCDSKSRAEARAVFCAFNSNAVIAIAIHC